MTSKSPTARSTTRYRRASAVLPPITLSEDQAAALDRITETTGETKSAAVRRLIESEAKRHGH